MTDDFLKNNDLSQWGIIAKLLDNFVKALQQKSDKLIVTYSSKDGKDGWDIYMPETNPNEKPFCLNKITLTQEIMIPSKES